MRTGPEQVAPSIWRRDGAPVASSGLKHGAPRDLVEGRAKLSIQSRQRASSPANLTSAHDAGTT